MGRSKQGWKLQGPRAKQPHYQVRFSHGGKRHCISTRTRDRREATEVAARLYAEIVGGTRGHTTASTNPSAPLEELMAAWLASVEPRLAASTFDEYVRYCRRFQKVFQRLPALSSVNVQKYIDDRLQEVLGKTVEKELSALQGFVDWAVEHGYLPAALRLPRVPRRAIGTRRFNPQVVELSPEEVESILRELPETTSRHHPVRAFYTLMWEAGLRVGTLTRLIADDWNPDKKTLLIRAKADKSRFERELPVSDRAAAILDRVATGKGYIFSRVDYRHALRKAAAAACLP